MTRILHQSVKGVKYIVPIPKGGTVEKIGGPIRVLKVDRVVLGDISPQDVYREGFPEWTQRQFVELFKQHNGGLKDQIVTRIEFEYVELGSSSGDRGEQCANESV